MLLTSNAYKPPSQPDAQRLLQMTAEKLHRSWRVSHREQYANDPVKWVWDNLGYELKSLQPKVLQSLADGNDTIVCSGHKCGKTFVTACAVLWWLDTRPMSKVVMTAPGERQLKHVLWAEIRHLYRRWPARPQWTITAGMHLYNQQHPGDWFALGVYSNRPDNIEGFHTREEGKLLIVIDEAKGVEREFFDAVMSMQGLRMMTSVPPPDGRGYFAEACTARADAWNIFRMSSLDSPFVDEEWIKKARNDWGEDSVIWQARVLGQIPAPSDGEMLISSEQIERAVGRWKKVVPVTESGRSSIGCDVARFGDDTTVIITLREGYVIRIRYYQGKDTMWTVGELREAAAREAKMRKTSPQEIPIVVDDTGLGGGVTDRLKELGYNVIPINFAAKSRNPDYGNMRNELWFEMARNFDEIALPDMYGQLFPHACRRLSADLASVACIYTSQGRRIEPKEVTKKRLGRSPDYGDALALAYHGLRRGERMVLSDLPIDASLMKETVMDL